MNPEVRKLQVLNDLIAQTLDLITQRATVYGGLSHSPYIGMNPGVPGTFPMWNQGTGLSHTPAAVDPRYNLGFGFPAIDPRFGLQTQGYNPIGLSHTPYYPTYGYDPRANIGYGAVPFYDPRFVTPSMGLSHTAQDPRYAAFNTYLPYGNVGYPFNW